MNTTFIGSGSSSMSASPTSRTPGPGSIWEKGFETPQRLNMRSPRRNLFGSTYNPPETIPVGSLNDTIEWAMPSPPSNLRTIVPESVIARARRVPNTFTYIPSPRDFLPHDTRKRVDRKYHTAGNWRPEMSPQDLFGAASEEMEPISPTGLNNTIEWEMMNDELAPLDRTYSMSSPNETFSVGRADRTFSLSSPNETFSVGRPDRTFSLSSPNETFSVGSPGQLLTPRRKWLRDNPTAARRKSLWNRSFSPSMRTPELKREKHEGIQSLPARFERRHSFDSSLSPSPAGNMQYWPSSQGLGPPMIKRPFYADLTSEEFSDGDSRAYNTYSGTYEDEDSLPYTFQGYPAYEDVFYDDPDALSLTLPTTMGERFHSPPSTRRRRYSVDLPLSPKTRRLASSLAPLTFPPSRVLDSTFVKRPQVLDSTFVKSPQVLDSTFVKSPQYSGTSSADSGPVIKGRRYYSHTSSEGESPTFDFVPDHSTPVIKGRRRYSNASSAGESPVFDYASADSSPLIKRPYYASTSSDGGSLYSYTEEDQLSPGIGSTSRVEVQMTPRTKWLRDNPAFAGRRPPLNKSFSPSMRTPRSKPRTYEDIQSLPARPRRLIYRRQSFGSPIQRTRDVLVRPATPVSVQYRPSSQAWGSPMIKRPFYADFPTESFSEGDSQAYNTYSGSYGDRAAYGYYDDPLDDNVFYDDPDALSLSAPPIMGESRISRFQFPVTESPISSRRRDWFSGRPYSVDLSFSPNKRK